MISHDTYTFGTVAEMLARLKTEAENFGLIWTVESTSCSSISNGATPFSIIGFNTYLSTYINNGATNGWGFDVAAGLEIYRTDNAVLIVGTNNTIPHSLLFFNTMHDSTTIKICQHDATLQTSLKVYDRRVPNMTASISPENAAECYLFKYQLTDASSPTLYQQYRANNVYYVYPATNIIIGGVYSINSETYIYAGRNLLMKYA